MASMGDGSPRVAILYSESAPDDDVAAVHASSGEHVVFTSVQQVSYLSSTSPPMNHRLPQQKSWTNTTLEVLVLYRTSDFLGL